MAISRAGPENAFGFYEGIELELITITTIYNTFLFVLGLPMKEVKIYFMHISTCFQVIAAIGLLHGRCTDAFPPKKLHWT